MEITLSPHQQEVIISLAQKVRGSRGGSTVTKKKLQSLKRIAKLGGRPKKAA